MSTDTVAILGFVALFALMLLRVPVGMAMGLVGISGFSYLVGGAPALKLVGQTSMRTVTDYTFGVIPMFLLMGELFYHTGLAGRCFNAADKLLGNVRGRLAYVTLIGGTAYAGPAGSSERRSSAGKAPPNASTSWPPRSGMTARTSTARHRR